MVNLQCMDNMDFVLDSGKLATLIYADHIFDERNFSWIDKYWGYLKPSGIFAVHTDHKLVSDLTVYMRDLEHSVWVNDIITIQRWGGVPRNRFPQKHDYIIVYAKGEGWHWDSSSIQVPKQMVNEKFNPSGRTMKTPDACWEDLGNFSTTSGERVKTHDGKNIQWQKPVKQLYRLFSPFVQKGDLIIDPFMGSGTSGEVAITLGCDYVGIENDPDIFSLAEKRIFNVK